MAQIFIGMPVYNGERFIREAIDSLRNQSFTDWTMLISDDASTDGTAAICQAYARKDPRITYHRQEKNIGMFPNFKFLIDKADDEYFMWAAQDDIWDPEFLSVCTAILDTDHDVSVAATGMADVDSFGRVLRVLDDFPSLSGRATLWTVARFVLQPEILGKCNIMYSLFRTNAIKKIWEIYPQRYEWGSDYHFSLAAISHFGIRIDPRILFKKRHGGWSNPLSTLDDKPDSVRKIEIKNPKNHMFPFGRFRSYFNSHTEALEGTPYKQIAAILLYIRLPRAWYIHLKERVANKIKKYA